MRAEKGLTTLWTDWSWNDWAATRAYELSISYGHGRPGGGSWINAIGDNYTIGENIAAGQSSGYNFYCAFLNSPQHYDLMIAEDAVGIGVGIYVAEDGSTYCAMVILGSY